jgi:4-hydroxythreonine-4-phosphate dehydrogenase
MTDYLPLIGISMGDPSGIGPEIVLKSIARREIRESSLPVVVGKRDYLEGLADHLKLSLEFCSFSDVKPHPFSGKIPVFEPDALSFPRPCFGKISPECGSAALLCVREAAALCLEKKLDGLVTAPVSKEAIELAGHPFHGHTGFLRDFSGVPRTGMLFTVPAPYKIGLFTTHVSLKEAIRKVRKEELLSAIQFFYKGIKDLFWEEPRIAVSALNPHAGEGGSLGTEEETEIRPAIEECLRKGIAIDGPFPADTLVVAAKRKGFNLLFFLLHDQAMILVKSLYFRRAVNVTIGLPFVRTSPAHGIALDIAGKNEADASSMVEAILQCVRLSFLHDAHRRQPGEKSDRTVH